MTEIEKMFENAGAEKKRMCEWTCRGNEFCSTNCEHYESTKEFYPPFTADKQLELIKFLLDKYCDIRIRKNLEGAYYITSFNDISCFSEDFEETLASFTNTHLQDLTDQEKEEIRRILNE